MPNPKAHFRVTVEIPDGVRLTEMADYIRTAVKQWKGQCGPRCDGFPEGPIVLLKEDTVKVRRVLR